MTDLVPGVSNMILYGVQFEKELGDDVAEHVARQAVKRPDAYLTTEEMYAGIVGALASEETLTSFIPGHDERDYRDFLARVVRHLDAMRPWPPLPFQPLNPQLWPGLDSARLIARIRLDSFDITNRLHHYFARIEDGREVFALRLRSGTEVALVAEWWPGSEDTALLLRDEGQAVADVLREFCSAVGIAPEEITAVGQG